MYQTRINHCEFVFNFCKVVHIAHSWRSRSTRVLYIAEAGQIVQVHSVYTQRVTLVYNRY